MVRGDGMVVPACGTRGVHPLPARGEARKEMPSMVRLRWVGSMCRRPGRVGQAAPPRVPVSCSLGMSSLGTAAL